MKVAVTPFYEEKLFDDGTTSSMWFRTTPGGAWQKKAPDIVVKVRPPRKSMHLLRTGTPIDRLLAAVQTQLAVPTRRALLERLNIDGASISRIRSGKLPVTPVFLLRIYDCTTFSIEELRDLAGLPNPRAVPPKEPK